MEEVVVVVQGLEKTLWIQKDRRTEEVRMFTLEVLKEIFCNVSDLTFTGNGKKDDY